MKQIVGSLKSAVSRLHHFTIAPHHHVLTLLIFFFISNSSSSSILLTPGPDEAIKQITKGIQEGDATKVMNHLSTMVDLILPGYNDTYARRQAGQILKEFFYQNPVKSFKVTKQGSSENGSHYAIGELQSGAKSYRVYFLLQAGGGQNLIQQLKIEEGNNSGS
jgi:hypothetical protein